MRRLTGENEKMKRPILDSRRKVAMAIVGAFPGGRECAATFLGLDLKRFDNQLYESTGHRPLSDEQLQQLEQVSGTHYLPDYIAGLYNGLFTALPDATELDNVELYHLALAADVKEGQLNQTIADAIGDMEPEPAPCIAEAAAQVAQLAAPAARIEFALWDDGRVSIYDGDHLLMLHAADTARLARLLGVPGHALASEGVA